MTETQNQENDLFPSLNVGFVERLDAALQQHFGSAAPTITWEHWMRLKPILATYKRDAEFLRGFVNKGHVRQLNKVAKCSCKLSEAIEMASTAGLCRILDEAIAPMRLEELHQALQAFDNQLSFKAPKEPFLADTSRQQLYENFEMWWCSTTRQRPQIEEGVKGDHPPTPFMYVANDVFNLPEMPAPTGASYKTLKDHQRAVRQEKEKKRKQASAFAALRMRFDPALRGLSYSDL